MVHAVKAHGVDRALPGDRIAVGGPRDDFPEDGCSPAQRLREILGVHQRCGDGELELKQGEPLVVEHSLPQDISIDEGGVHKVVQ